MSMSSVTAASGDDAATVIAVGVLAATLAIVCHETLGHGLGCLGTGGHVTLLTSIWFRCSTGSPITDAGGPIGNLVAGILAVVLLGSTRPSPTGRLFLLLFAALNLFWLTAQITFESATTTPDDWYWVLQMRPAISRPVGIVVGIVGYVLVGRWISAVNRKQGGPKATAILLGYAAAAAAAVIAGLLWRPEPFRSAFQGFLTLGVASLGLLRIARTANRNLGRDLGAGSTPRSWTWIVIGILLFGFFLFAQAPGLGERAGLPLQTLP